MKSHKIHFYYNLITIMAFKNVFLKYKNYNQILILFQKYPLKIRNYTQIYILRSSNILSKNSPLITKQNCINYTSEAIHSSDSEVEIETEEDYLELDEDSHYGNRTISVRKILNANINDPLVAQLNECASVQEVFNIVDKYENQMNVMNISQAILILWDLQKYFYKHNVFYHSETNVNTDFNANSLLKSYVDQVITHKDFQKLLKLVENNYEDFSFDALSCSLLYLNRIGVDINKKVMQKMINRCEKEILKNQLSFPLTALSRFTVTVFSQEDSLWSILVSKNVLPIVISKLQSCNTADEFKLLTICLNKLHHLVTADILETYKQTAEKLIETNKVSSSNHRTIIKVLMFLNRAHWHEDHTSTIRKFMCILKDNINMLSNKEIVTLFKIFQIQKEPADMLDEIQETASLRLSQIEKSDMNLEITLDILSCVVSFSSPLQRPKFEELARTYIKNSLTPLSLTAMYKILHHIKPTDIKLCNSFWDKALKLITQDKSNELNKLLNLCHKYIHFNNDVSHRYRYYKFEKSVIDRLLCELEFGISGYMPHKFSRIASFIIAYSNNREILDLVTNKCVEMKEQFSSVDVLNISKGLQLALENMNYRNTTYLNKYINSINSLLDECVEREICINQNYTLPNINILMRGFVFRKGEVEHPLFKIMLDFYLKSAHEFSSHILRDLCFTLLTNKCFVSEIVDKMVDYVIKMEKSILGSTADKLLYLCYYVGYFPKNYDEFFKIVSELIIRDKERFSGLSFLQASLALCFFHQLPETLVKHIFSVNFLEKIDEELSHCYSKTTYPVRVRDNMMQLNRAVCLDYPESNVPWFHEKYVNEIKKQESRKTYFNQKVLLTLTDAIKDENAISQNVLSPYGYQLDFVIDLPKNSNESAPRKIAVLILQPQAFTTLNKNLKGYYQMKQRHLEILGYEVLLENQADWKNLYTHENCISYMTERIWPKRRKIIQSSL